MIEDRQRERRGLAGAGLGDADDVALAEQQRDGLGLDRSGVDVTFFVKRTEDRLCEANSLKEFNSSVFQCANTPPRRRASGRETRGLRHPAWTGLPVQRNAGGQGLAIEAGFEKA